MNHFVVISGNIAVGKSTLTQRLSEHLNWKPYLEAFDKNPYLADFYEDMERWSFHSQIFFLSRRLQHHHALAQYPGDVVQDRSVYEDAEIFARNLYLQGDMSERDYGCYRDLYNGVKTFLPSPTLVVYLKAPVGVIAGRIAERGRDYERRISIDYLMQINNLYEEWTSKWAASPILEIDAQKYDFAHNEEDVSVVIGLVQEALTR